MREGRKERGTCELLAGMKLEKNENKELEGQSEEKYVEKVGELLKQVKKTGKKGKTKNVWDDTNSVNITGKENGMNDRTKEEKRQGIQQCLRRIWYSQSSRSKYDFQNGYLFSVTFFIRFSRRSRTISPRKRYPILAFPSCRVKRGRKGSTLCNHGLHMAGKAHSPCWLFSFIHHY